MFKIITAVALLLATPLVAADRDYTELFGHKLGDPCVGSEFKDSPRSFFLRDKDDTLILDSKIKSSFKLKKVHQEEHGITLFVGCHAVDETVRYITVRMTDPKLGKLLLGKSIRDIGRKPDSITTNSGGTSNRWDMPDNIRLYVSSPGQGGGNYSVSTNLILDEFAEYYALREAGVLTELEIAEAKLLELFN